MARIERSRNFERLVREGDALEIAEFLAAKSPKEVDQLLKLISNSRLRKQVQTNLNHHGKAYRAWRRLAK